MIDLAIGIGTSELCVRKFKLYRKRFLQVSQRVAFSVDDQSDTSARGASG